MSRQKYLFGSIYNCLRHYRYVSGSVNNGNNLYNLCTHLGISENIAEFMSIRHPVVTKIDEGSLKSVIQTVNELGFSKDVLVEKPQLIGILPITLRFRYQVLSECGFADVSPELILNYLTVMKQQNIGHLKKSGLIPDNLNVENRLAGYMTQWPTSLTTAVWGDIDKMTLFKLRLQIIQRYLELVLELTEVEYGRGIATYPTIKHRPLAVINETLTILQSQIRLPLNKIKSNLYLVHVDPENLKNILFKFKSIGGIDIKEVIRLHPKIAMRNYDMLVKTRKVLKEYNISNEAQKRCLDIYTLNSDTVRERLERAHAIPEFKAYLNHPRFLKVIHYNNTAMKRLQKLYKNNKKCLSLNILSGSSAHYETFEKAPGDSLGKGKDLVFCINQSLGGTYKSSDIHKMVRKHPFWINIPLVQVKYVYEQLAKEFTPKDIFDNCPILLYPWSKIKDMLNKQRNNETFVNETLDISILSKSQKLSLILYGLEKDHYFTGNGVWNEEKNKNVVYC